MEKSIGKYRQLFLLFPNIQTYARIDRKKKLYLVINCFVDEFSKDQCYIF